MAIEVAVWNTQDSFSDGERMDMVLKQVFEADPDVAVFPEAHREGQTHLLGDACNLLEDIGGYTIATTSYNDQDGRADRHGLFMVAKRELVRDTRIIQMAGRTALMFEVAERDSQKTMDIFGVHLDDRHEKTRRQQACSLLAAMREGVPTVVAGDMNALHGQTDRARRIRPASVVTEFLPAKDPVPGVKQSKVSRMSSLLQRAVRMADGSTLRVLEEAGFEDADPEYRPTMPSKYPLLQLDHILYDKYVRTDPTAFMVHPHNPAADHRMVSALVEAK